MLRLSDKERLDWLQLIRTPSIGPITFYRLLEKYGTAASALAALPDISRNAGRKTPLRAYDRSRAEAELAEADKRGARLIAFCESNYPRALASIPDPPPVIYLRGHDALFEKPAIAIVGARNASGVGRKIARTLAADLGAAGVVIVSGLARGLDGAAHEAALATGTIAVVAGGVDIIYPPEHANLTERIAQEGVVLSECPMGYRPTGRDFPKRNRLISGLARGVIIVEAAAKSGTLITARFALEQGREVFAVPGSPLDPRCQGANRLIRDGAILTESAEDVLDFLAQQERGVSEKDSRHVTWFEDEPQSYDSETFSSLRQRLLELMSYTPLHRDEIIRELSAPPGLAADALLDLTLSEEIEELPGGRFVLSAENAL